MKTYKIWEVIKMIAENHKLEFERTDSYMSLKKQMKGVGFYKDGENIPLYRLNIESEWTLVQQPVTFMEAVKSGKRLRVEHEHIYKERPENIEWISEHYSELDGLMYTLSRHSDQKVLADIIENGKWYIEE